MTGIAEFYEGILNNPNLSIAPQSTEWVAELERTYDSVRAKLSTSSAYKAPKILAPVITFMFFKMSAVFVNTQDYLEHVGMERRKFLSYLSKIQPFFEEYSLRDRRAYVDSVIKSVIESFELGSEFQSCCQEMLDVFFSQLKNTTEEMIAAMVCVLSKIMLDKKETLIKKLCDHVGVGAGSINTFFKKKLAKQVLGADEFKGFVKSSELIKVNCLKILDNFFLLKINGQDIKLMINNKDEINNSAPLKGEYGVLLALRRLKNRDGVKSKAIMEELDLGEAWISQILKKLGEKNYCVSKTANKIKSTFITPLGEKIAMRIIKSGLRLDERIIKKENKKEGFAKSSELIKVNCLKILDNNRKLPKKPMEKKPMEKKEKAIAPPQKEINFKDMFSRISKKLYIELESELLGYLEGVPGISIELISLMTSEITKKSLELFSEALKSVKLMKKE